MANYTKKAILQTFEEMLGEMSFDKITVSAIVARCEISPNTFYYHFQDIYDLLNTWLDVKKEKLLRELDGIGDWSERTKAVYHKIQDNSRYVYHIFDAMSRERLERYVFDFIENEFYEICKKEVTGSAVSEEELKKISSLYCYVFLGFFLKFLWKHMEVDVDATVDEFKELVQNIAGYIAKRGVEESRENVT